MLSKEIMKFLGEEKNNSKSMKNVTIPKTFEAKPVFYLVLKTVKNN